MSKSSDLFLEELDAFDPQWRLRYATLFDAATACGCEDLYAIYLRSGGTVDRLRLAAPDYRRAAEKAAESATRFEDASS